MAHCVSAWKLAGIALLLQCIASTVGYKPVIVIHGILDSASDLQELTKYIKTAHPGTKVYPVDLFDYYNSFQPLWYQVEAIRNVTEPIMKASKDGVHVIGYSQEYIQMTNLESRIQFDYRPFYKPETGLAGSNQDSARKLGAWQEESGLVARGIIQTTDSHNVHSFIALSSPLNGQYGDTYFFSWLFPHYLKEELYKLFYTDYGQQWSIGNYWKDPHEFGKYEQYSNFLAQLENRTQMDTRLFTDSWRTNFARLRKLVLIGGPDDEVISPWQSAHFGFFDENEEVVLMRQLEIYKNDTFGLKTLDKAKALTTCTFPGVRHLQWHKNPTVFAKCIEPYLT